VWRKGDYEYDTRPPRAIINGKDGATAEEGKVEIMSIIIID
jgi:hypothetical protein